MNEELQKRLTSYLDVLETSARRAGEFAETEIPEAIKEWLIWMAVERAFWAFLFLALAAMLFVYCGRSMVKVHAWLTEKKLWGDPEVMAYCTLWIGRTVIPLILCSFALWEVVNVVKVCVAPRVVIVQAVVGLAKNRR